MDAVLGVAQPVRRMFLVTTKKFEGQSRALKTKRMN